MSLLAATVMAGPQLTQAVSVSKRVRESLPGIPVVWGGYFPTQHGDTVLKSDFVDFVVRSQGERALLNLLEVLRNGGSFSSVGNLSWKDGRGIRENPLRSPTPLDELPDLPYHRVDMDDYVHADLSGRAHHRPQLVVRLSVRLQLLRGRGDVEPPLARPVGRAHGADRGHLARPLRRRRGADARTWTSSSPRREPRSSPSASRPRDDLVGARARRRADALSETCREMARSGLKMVFCGAESGSDAMLARMNKGGNASAELTLELARRMRHYGVVPELSFVLGTPPEPEADIERSSSSSGVKRANPATEVILYLYTPVPLDGTLYDEARAAGFAFPRPSTSGRRATGGSSRCGAETPPWIRPRFGGASATSSAS